MFILCRSGKGTNHQVTKEVGLTLCEVMVSYDAANHERVVDLLYPIRGQIYRIGGTQAQVIILNMAIAETADHIMVPWNAILLLGHELS